VRICVSGATGSIGKHLPAMFPFTSRLEEDSASIVREFEFNMEMDELMQGQTMFAAEYDKLKTVYDENGKKILNQMYDYINLRSDCFIVHNDKKCRIFSLNGNDIVGDVFDHVYWTSLNGESYLIAESSVDLDKN